MRVVYLADRISLRGGADQHLLQVVEWAVGAGHDVVVAAGRIEVTPPWMSSLQVERIRGLAGRVGSADGLDRLPSLLARADVVHVQNLMNPTALTAATATGHAVVTIQDHRVFCPGPGKTLPDGSRCRTSPSDNACAQCLTDASYRDQMLEVTKARQEAIRGAALVTLSRYMAAELEWAGLPAAAVIPPWIRVADGPPIDGDSFLLGGRLVTHKAPLDGWSAWRRGGCGLPLRVAGAGPAATDLAGAQRLGWLAPSDLATELRQSRALLFPSRWQEPLGILGIEALGQATPVIVARSGGTAEWSDEGCLVVEPGDVDAMADAVTTLARDPGLAVSLGQRGRTMVAERFARPSIASRLELLYRSVADGAAPVGSGATSVAAPPASG
jgi:glycosyltransferase involved in cell wall biosynthesis